MINVLICGATGFIGRNLVNFFSSKSDFNVFAIYNKKKQFKSDQNINNITWIKADLLNDSEVQGIFKRASIDVVIQAAATTSGAKDIVTRPYIHVTDNAIMNSLLLRQSMESCVKHFIFFSCSVMYKNSHIALKESDWDPSDPINEKYFGAAHTKLYIEKMLEFYSIISNMKTTAIRHSNIYGPYDKFDLERSHVFGATISKVMRAKKSFTFWGTGEEERDFLYVDDLMDFVDLCILKQQDPYKMYNCGSGRSISIKKLISSIVSKSEKKLEIFNDLSKPTIKTSLFIDSSLAEEELGWSPKIDLDYGIEKTLSWWNDNIDPINLEIKKRI
tara:strand:+ start:3932 stop:4924 length:993 start_codon:yes stop_codon:yes gene_type:complete